MIIPLAVIVNEQLHDTLIKIPRYPIGEKTQMHVSQWVSVRVLRENLREKRGHLF